jgi:Tfp pilus assembly protein PilV
MRSRPGFTLVEVLLAIILIDVALLALVGSSAVLVRQTNALRLRNAALRAATNRLQQLAASCAATTGVATSADGVRERWTVLALNGAVDALDSVTFSGGGSTHAIVLQTRLPC